MKLQLLKAIKASLVTGLLFAAVTASASVVNFNSGVNTNVAATSFADGTFSTNLSGNGMDGFYNCYQYSHACDSTGSTTKAFNAFGVANEYISFYAPVTINSLDLAAWTGGSASVSLFDASNALLASVTTFNTNIFALTTYTFNTSNVSKIQFTKPTHDWFVVDHITYNVDRQTVPEPTSIALLGLGMLGFAAARRRKQ